MRSRTSFALFSIVLLLAACSGPVATQLPVIPSLPSRSSEASTAPTEKPTAEPTKTPKGTQAASTEPSVEPTGVASESPSEEPSTPPESTEPSLPASAIPSPLAVCGPIESLSTKTPGRLTLSTDNPAFPPWWGGDVATQYPNEPQGGDPWTTTGFGGDPYSMEGYEGATAYAIANAMGFTPDKVDWLENISFPLAFAAGPKLFDFHMAQVSIRPKRALNVDFSDPYFEANQAIIAMTKNPNTGDPNPILHAQNINDLKAYKLGAQISTTSFDFINDVIQPSQEIAVYPTNTAARQALQNGQIDGLVVDLGTAFYMRDAQLDDFNTPDPEATIVGQFSVEAQADPVGAVLQKDSPLTPCVNQAIQTIKDNGTLQTIYDTWIQSGQDIPVLQ